MFLKRKPLYLRSKLTNSNNKQPSSYGETMAELSDKTRAIVLTSTPVNDRTQFVHFYTEVQGRVTCKIPLASRGKKAQQLRTQMSPMTLLELVLRGNPNDEIKQIAEVEVIRSPYTMTFSHPEKASQCFFMAELLAHTVREEESNPRLWNYLIYSMDRLEHCEKGWSNFHLVFTKGLTGLLGFEVDADEYQPGHQFDLIEGTFTDQTIYHPYYLNEQSAAWFCRLLKTSYDTMHELQLNKQGRAALLDIQLAFLAQQIPEMGTLKSIEVLKSLFD